ncbi:MAG: sigma-54-dependent Fis family transcriptional regulator, partial [Calditrichaeota bacterium]|nr:sigma-54-dependent Fis family transcriptional regulator [Calditrichota bacterium]
VNRERLTDLSTFSSGILQRVIEEKAPCLYHDVQSDPNLSQFESVLIHQIKSVIGVPIFHQGEVWGVILADSREDRREFTEENLTFLDFFSNLVSLALDKIIRFEALERENRILENRLQGTQAVPDMIGESKPMRQMAAMLHRVARTDATVLILGESGTGKDLVARAIHTLSERGQKPYLAQFCGSIPDTLLESELFGFKKGAFSGATADKKGLLEVCDGGTFFLDEIADVSLALQAKLLRVIQNKEIIPLGDTKTRTIDVRILAATNKNLQQMVQDKTFREDLFYRLNVFPITLPPLRERRSDIPLLLNHFIRRYDTRPITVAREALKTLTDFPWPGNVRQLENVIQRALIMCDGHQLQPEHIIIDEGGAADGLAHGGTLREFEMALLKKRLAEFDGNRTKTAESLGVSVRWVQLKLRGMEGEGA